MTSFMICITEEVTGTEVKYWLTHSNGTATGKVTWSKTALSMGKSTLIILTSFHERKEKSEQNTQNTWYKEVHNKDVKDSSTLETKPFPLTV